MQRRLMGIIAVALTALAIAACGGSSSGAGSSPATQALSYFPAGSPLVMTVATDPHSQAIKQLQGLEHRFPAYAAGATALFARLSQMGIDYNSDIRPLFGNPIAVGAAGTSGLGGPGSRSFLVAWVTKSADALSRLVGKLHGAHSAGSHDGAKLYSNGGSTAAIDGATVLIANSPATVEAALDRHAHNTGLTSADYARETSGVSTSGLVTVFGDLTGALSGNQAATARRVPWVAAIRGYGVSIDASQSGLTLSYRIDTGGRQLSVSQLPIASGTASPGLAGDLPIQASLRDPAQTIDFVLSALQATKPSEYARLIAEENALKAATGIDAGQLISGLTGNLNLESDGHTTLARVQVSSPSSVSGMLAKLAQVGSAMGSGLRSLGNGFYATRSGTRLTLGVVSGQLVLGNASPAQLAAFAAAPAGAAGETGAVSFRIALSQLASLAMGGAPSAAVQQVLGLLGDVTGSVQSTTGGLSGTATLGLR